MRDPGLALLSDLPKVHSHRNVTLFLIGLAYFALPSGEIELQMAKVEKV